MLLRTYLGVEEHRLPDGAPFEAIFLEPKKRPRARGRGGQSVCFDSEDRDYLTVGEGKKGLIYRIRRIEKPAAGGGGPPVLPRDESKPGGPPVR